MKFLKILSAIIFVLLLASGIYMRFYSSWGAKRDLTQICEVFKIGLARLEKGEDPAVVSAETAVNISAGIKHVAIARAFAAMTYVDPSVKFATFKRGAQEASGEMWDCRAADEMLR